MTANSTACALVKPASGEADDNERAAGLTFASFETKVGRLLEEALDLARRSHRSCPQLDPGAVGSFFLGGLWGTQFWIDPAEKLVGLQMIQAGARKGRAAVPFLGNHYLAYGALTVPDPLCRPAGDRRPGTLAD